MDRNCAHASSNNDRNAFVRRTADVQRMKHTYALLCLVLCSLAAQANLSVTFHSWNEYCGNNNGRIEATASGGQAPYTYSWDNGGTSAVIVGLNAGTYTLTLTDNLGAQVVQGVTLTDMPNIEIPDFAWSGLVMGSGVILVSQSATHPCEGQCNGGFAWSEISFTPTLVQPIGYNIIPTEVQAFGPIFIEFCEGAQPYLEITDATGCFGTFPIDMIVGTGAGPMSLTSVEPACGTSGSITFSTGSLAYGNVNLLYANYQPTGQYTPIGGDVQATFNSLAAGDYVLERIQDLTYYDCPEYLPVNVPSVGSPCGTVSGTVHLDHDQDCVQDGNDEPLPLRVLEVLPGPQYTITDWNGHYDLGMVYGNFTIDQQDGSDLYQICPVGAQVPFTIDAGNVDVIVDFADSSLIPLDVEAMISTSALRPGFAVNIWGGAHNLSGQLSGPLDITLTFDPVLGFVSAQPTPTFVVGNTVTWSGIAGLSAFGGANVNVVAQAPPDVLLIGTDASFTLTVSQPLTETTLTNNSATETRTFTGSYDPNEKTVRTSSGLHSDLFIIGEDEYLDYAIQFQNTGTDTAFTVVVTDTLGPELDMGTFQQGLASHSFDVSFKEGRVVEWRFENILLPDSGTNEAASHGLVSFRIRPVDPLLPGMVISNTANIFFDFNPPVITEPSVITAEFSTQVQVQELGQLTIYPNPASDQLRVGVDHGAIVRVRIVSVDGREVLQQFLGDPSGAIDVAHLASGAYVLVAETTDHQQFRHPFSILHP